MHLAPPRVEPAQRVFAGLLGFNSQHVDDDPAHVQHTLARRRVGPHDALRQVGVQHALGTQTNPYAPPVDVIRSMPPWLVRWTPRCRLRSARFVVSTEWAARRRQARRGLGWFGTSEVAASHSAGAHALHSFQRSDVAGRRHSVPRRGGRDGLVIKARQPATTYSLWTRPLAYWRVPTCRKTMSRCSGPKSGIPEPRSTGMRVMMRR